MKPNKKRSKQDIIDGNFERPICEAYKVIDTDLARDNLENDLPAGDLEDL